MPIIIKDAKLTDGLVASIKQISSNINGLYSLNFLSRVRETDEGVEIPCGFYRLFIGIKEKHPTAELVHLDATLVRKVFMDRNNMFFGKFKEHNKEYIHSGKNVLLKINSAPDGIMDSEKVVTFLKKIFSKIVPTPDHKFKVTAKYPFLTAIREGLDEGIFKDATGVSVKGRCSLMATRYIKDRPPQRGTRVAVIVPAADIDKIFSGLLEGDLFERVPSVRFVNPETRHQRIQELQEKDVAADKKSGSATVNKQKKHKEGKSVDGTKAFTSGQPGQKRNAKNAQFKRRYRFHGERLPNFLRIMNIPNGITLEDIKLSLNESEHGSILKAIAESRLQNPRHPDPSVISFFCTEENGKLLMDSFSVMDINGSKLTVTLDKAR